MNNQSTLLNHVQILQDAHPWMLEREAGSLLVCIYSALRNGMGLRGAALQEQIEISLGKLTNLSRTKIEEILSDQIN